MQEERNAVWISLVSFCGLLGVSFITPTKPELDSQIPTPAARVMAKHSFAITDTNQSSRSQTSSLQTIIVTEPKDTFVSSLYSFLKGTPPNTSALPVLEKSWKLSYQPKAWLTAESQVLYDRTNQPSLGTLGLHLGSGSLLLNFNYQYNQTRASASELTRVLYQDQASLGFILFWGASQNYSLFLGNQFQNIFFVDGKPNYSGWNQTSSPTFSAAFRGTNPAFSRSKFFFQFQNQWNRDGLFVPYGFSYLSPTLQGRSFYEYVTSMGMELSF